MFEFLGFLRYVIWIWHTDCHSGINSLSLFQLYTFGILNYPRFLPTQENLSKLVLTAELVIRRQHLNRLMTKPTKWLSAQRQISMGICPVWSESLLSAWRKLGSLATHWANSKASDQTGQMVLSWGGSFMRRLKKKLSSNFHGPSAPFSSC